MMFRRLRRTLVRSTVRKAITKPAAKPFTRLMVLTAEREVELL